MLCKSWGPGRELSQWGVLGASERAAVLLVFVCGSWFCSQSYNRERGSGAEAAVGSSFCVPGLPGDGGARLSPARHLNAEQRPAGEARAAPLPHSTRSGDADITSPAPSGPGPAPAPLVTATSPERPAYVTWAEPARPAAGTSHTHPGFRTAAPLARSRGQRTGSPHPPDAPAPRPTGWH